MKNYKIEITGENKYIGARFESPKYEEVEALEKAVLRLGGKVTVETEEVEGQDEPF